MDGLSASEARSHHSSHQTALLRQIDLEQAACHDVKLLLDGFALDELTLANSSLLPYMAMVATVIEGRNIDVDELLHVLRENMRQRSFDRLPRREYVLGFLTRHPP